MYFYTIFYGLFFGFLSFGIFDFILKKIVIEKARYFCLHVILNSWVCYKVFDDTLDLLKNPNSALDLDYSKEGVLTTSAIAAFHIYHILFFKKLSSDDYIHHLVSSILVGTIGVLLPFGRLSSLCNFTLCGLPGGIDYFLLILLKYNIINKITEKKINRFLNLIIRWPIMFLCGYMFILNINKLNNKDLNTFSYTMMILALLLHSFNAIYYCDRVIGNYYVVKKIEN